MASRLIVILGAGGLARETYWLLQGSQYTDFIFVDDLTSTTELILGAKCYPVVKNWNFAGLGASQFIIGIDSPNAKKIMVEKAISVGLAPAPTFVHPKAIVQDAVIGVGGVVGLNCVVTTNVKIGNYVLLNASCTVGHDVVIHDWVSANPGCHISGKVIIGDSVTLGTGTTVREEISITSGVVTGAQSAVVSNLTEAGTYVGIPAKLLRKSL